MSSEPKPNIRPGVRGIRRDGFWSPPIEASDDPLFQWKAGGMTWTAEGNYFGDSCVSPFDIVAIVEDLPTVPSQKQKSYWRLLEVGEVVQRGDEAWDQERAEWQKIKPYFHGVRPDPRDIYRRRVHAPSGHFVPAEHYVPPAEFEQLKADAAKWREIERRSVEAGCDIDAQAEGWCLAWNLKCNLGPADRGQSGNGISKLLHWMQRAHEDATKWREHVANPKTAPQIPGMPEGWEFCQVGKGLYEVSGEFGHIDLVLRRIKPLEPVCTWQHGVFRDGWLCEDQDGEWYWHETMPNVDGVEWVSDLHIARMYGLLTQPKFRDDLPWDQRCVKVGPEAEKGMGQ